MRIGRTLECVSLCCNHILCVGSSGLHNNYLHEWLLWLLVDANVIVGWLALSKYCMYSDSEEVGSKALTNLNWRVLLAEPANLN